MDQHVLGEADHHGTRPAAEGCEDGVVHHAGGGGGVVERHDLLGGAAEPGVDVEFLERLPAAVRDRDEAHEQDHRRGVLVRGVDGDEGVGRTRTPGHHGHARKLREPAFGEGHESGAALVAGHHGFNGGSVQAVQHIQEALPGDTVDALDTGAFQLGNNQVPGGGCGARCLQYLFFDAQCGEEQAGQRGQREHHQQDDGAGPERVAVGGHEAVAISGTKPEMTPRAWR